MKEDIMLQTEDLINNIQSIDDAFNIALAIEKQGHDFYLEKIGSSISITARDLFAFLAEEETRHTKYILDFQKTGSTTTLRKLVPPDFKASFEREYPSEKPGEMDVLMGALSFEKKNEKLYRKLAARVSDPEQKEFFEIMGDFEHRHLEIIDGFIEAATQFRMQT